MFVNTPGAMAPWGGSKAVFGTNPVAFACPLPGRAPLVIDLSLSKVARGNIMTAKQRGEKIPEGWALDEDGKPTTDPDAALRGTMVPMGDAKGTALALMVELLAAGLTGANFAAEASSYLDADGAPSGHRAADPGVRSGGVRRRRGGALRRCWRHRSRRSPARGCPACGGSQARDKAKARRADDFRRADGGDRGGVARYIATQVHRPLHVMPGLVPGIPILGALPCLGNRDGRDKPGHDEHTIPK